MTYSIDDFILSLFAHGNKVRASTLYQLLKGKRTISIISYGYLYDSLPYFAIFPEFQEYQFNQIIKRLLRNQLLLESNDKVVITRSGKSYLEQHQMNVPTSTINGFKYSRNDELFKSVLLLVIQVSSELSFHNKHYLPIELNGFRQMLVKKWLAMQLEKQSKTALVQSLSIELTTVLDWLVEDSLESSLFFSQISGHGLTGKTLAQLSDELNMSPLEALLIDRNSYHFIMGKLNMKETPLLASVYQLIYHYPYNQSAAQSYALYKEIRDVNEVMHRRRIKQSTLDEHLLEFAIIDEAFPFEDFLYEELYDELLHLNELFPNEKEWVFQVIEKNAQVPLTYFEMRLYQLYRKKMTLNGSSY
ncbi:helix-turn-helix domain-containing protein [Vagococcus xieshaowenii]|uniref:Helicase Helix-turn-helix domain-containing protein n=1 Tax=Vagococcus xieshaowenii TaxID=2562451 RepID=A0AAJ5EF68_9ENTE|nr:helix-turn-helix domain-containing protein [Vagococcus xieshaowenii]QCA28713.1 hypothetical protein E4Z98_05045 [Vagococcus xieshaowenii]TFZ40479.1 hypothetical protein E4031_06730 [Vagococcus xieshaowenii]